MRPISGGMDAAAVVEPKAVSPRVEAKSVLGQADDRPVKEDAPVNRETKLALLIGFVAIVVVTVLVGEHFGKARNAAPATTDLGTSTAAAPTNTGLTVDPITAVPVTTPSSGGPAVLPIGGSVGGPVQPVELKTTGMGEAGTAAPMAGRDTFIPAAGVDTLGHSTLGNGMTPPPAAPVARGEVPGTMPVDTIGNVPPGFETGGERMGVSPAPLTVTPVAVEKMHPVQKGETLSGISQKHYGTKSLADELAAYNKGKVGANMSVRQGVTLRIPSREALTGKAAPTGRTEPVAAKPVVKATSAKVTSEKASSEKPKATGPRNYVVKKGDTLMTIASRELGSAKRWEALSVANRGLDENSLRVGMTIKIPAAR